MMGSAPREFSHPQFSRKNFFNSKKQLSGSDILAISQPDGEERDEGKE
jgi:hypothetical protein